MVTRQPSRPISRARQGRAATLGLAAVLVVGLSGLTDPTPRERLTIGVWRGQQGPWVVALEFRLRGDRLDGLAHVLENGRKWTEASITRVELDPPKLSWHLEWGPSWQQDFRGRVDLEGGTIAGQISSTGAAAQAISYRRTEPEAVAGLLARRARAGQQAYAYTRPVETGDGWPTAPPPAAGLERRRVDALMRAVIDGEGGDIHSLLIAKGGLLVAEEYFHGWSRDDLHRTASCTKSVASLLVGIALEQGQIAGLDVLVPSFFPELAENAAPGWGDVRLEHVLTMTSGLDRPESAGVENPGRALFDQLLKHPVATSPGTRWRYVNAEVDLLAGVLRQATGLDADAFAEAHLFGPLGIDHHEWPKADGFPSMAAGLRLRPRDMAKIGALVAARGQWRGRRLVSADWIDRSIRPHRAPAGEAEQYGYLWWTAVPPGALPELRAVYAKGVGSQFIFVVPALDLVVVTTGGNHANGKLMAIAELVFRHLLADS